MTVSRQIRSPLHLLQQEQLLWSRNLRAKFLRSFEVTHRSMSIMLLEDRSAVSLGAATRPTATTACSSSSLWLRLSIKAYRFLLHSSFRSFFCPFVSHIVEVAVDDSCYPAPNVLLFALPSLTRRIQLACPPATTHCPIQSP